MDKTKQITHGAMSLAIVGALILINRLLSFFFDPYVVALAAVIGIIYMYQSDIKYNIAFGIGLLIMAFFFGGQLVSIYMPISVIVAFVYSYGIKKGKTYLANFVYSSIVFVLGELIITLIILPILGFEGIDEMSAIVNEAFANAGLGLNALTVERFTKIAYLISIIIVGVMEATLVHLLALLSFRRLKIKTNKIMRFHLYTYKSYVAYVLFILVMAAYFINYIEVNDMVYYLVVGSGLLASIALFMEGVFLIIFHGKIKGKNYAFMLGLLIIFFFPLSYIIMVIVGFLYASGPLKKYFEVK